MTISLRQHDVEQPGRETTGTSRHGWLVADIGGTNARFALADPQTMELFSELTLSTRDARSLADLTTAYLRLAGAGRVEAACFAIAGPVTGDRW